MRGLKRKEGRVKTYPCVACFAERLWERGRRGALVLSV